MRNGVGAEQPHLTVTLNITGANTFTQTQTWLRWPWGHVGPGELHQHQSAQLGANTVTVTVPNDDNDANNSVAQPMATSATRSRLSPRV